MGISSANPQTGRKHKALGGAFWWFMHDIFFSAPSGAADNNAAFHCRGTMTTHILSAVGATDFSNSDLPSGTRVLIFYLSRQ